MLTGIENDQDVHFCAQIDVASGHRVTRLKMHLSCFIDRNLAEEVDVSDQISFT